MIPSILAMIHVNSNWFLPSKNHGEYLLPVLEQSETIGWISSKKSKATGCTKHGITTNPFKKKSKKLRKLGYQKATIATAFMNKHTEIHHPTDDPVSDASDDDNPSNQPSQDVINEDISTEIHNPTDDPISDEESEDIIDQLSTFGYSKQQSMDAMNNVTNKNDINSITDYIDRKTNDIMNTDDLTNPKRWDFVLNKMSQGLAPEQQLLVFLKLQLLAQHLIKNENDPNARVLSMDDSKLKHSVLQFDGGITFLYQLGFEHDSGDDRTLICDDTFNRKVVNVCVECLKKKMEYLKANVDFDRYRTGTISDNIIMICNPTDDDMSHNPTDDDDIHNPTDDAKQNVTDDDVHNPTDDAKQNVHNPTDQQENMSGETKQFYKFLNDNNLEKYFDAFREKECCSIKDLEYLVDAEKFLENDIGIKNAFHRTKMIGECKKVKTKMNYFEENVLMPPVIKKRLSSQGVVTMDILVDQIEHKSELQSKLGINDMSHCDLLWNIIRLQSISHSPSPPPPPRAYEFVIQQGQEGVHNENVASNETNYIGR
eukprot:481138_1